MCYKSFLIKNKVLRKIFIRKGVHMANSDQKLQELTRKEEITEPSTDVIITIDDPLQPIETSDTSKKIEENNSLNNIVTSQTKLMDVKKSLSAIVDAMADNPSIITRAASVWGELPLWQKILGGVVLTGPAVAVGILSQVSVLMVLGGVTGVVYTGSAIVLDDHHNCNVSVAERLKAGIISLADILQFTIDALDKIRQELAHEIERFRQENFKLSENVGNLGEQVESLSTQVEMLSETEKLLKADRDKLELTSQNLEKSVGDNKVLLEKVNKELVQVRDEYQQSQHQLCLKVSELQEVRSAMELEVEKAKQVGTILNGTVTNLSKTVLTDKTQREEFQAKLETFVTDEKASFHQVAERICKAEEELEIVKEQLKQSNDRYKQLLDKHENQVKRLEKIGVENIKSRINTKGLKQHGFHKPVLAPLTENVRNAVLVM